MKDLIIKIPIAVFLISLIIGPVISYNISHHYPQFQSFELSLILSIIKWSVISIWLLSIVSYFSHEQKSNKGNIVLYLLMITQFISGIFFENFSNELLNLVFLFLLIVLNSIFIIRKVRITFDERSRWFLFAETTIYIIGFFTLTSAIQEYDSNKNEN